MGWRYFELTISTSFKSSISGLELQVANIMQLRKVPRVERLCRLCRLLASRHFSQFYCQLAFKRQDHISTGAITLGPEQLQFLLSTTHFTAVEGAEYIDRGTSPPCVCGGRASHSGGGMVLMGVAENMVPGIRQRIFAHFLKE
jgi:hypothetical protein